MTVSRRTEQGEGAGSSSAAASPPPAAAERSWGSRARLRLHVPTMTLHPASRLPGAAQYAKMAK